MKDGLKVGNHVAVTPDYDALLADDENWMERGKCIGCGGMAWLDWRGICYNCDPGPCKCGNMLELGQEKCFECRN